MEGFSLELPTEEEVREQVVAELAPSESTQQAIASTVETKAKEVMAIDLDSVAQRKEVASVFQEFGTDVLKKSEKKNAIMERRLVTLSDQSGESGDVARGLEDLNLKMKDLDPSGIDFVKSGPLGKLFHPARRYFERFKTADAEISEIVKSLEKGRKTLVADNTALELEQAEMRDLTKKLTQSIEMGIQLDESISKAVEEEQVSGGDEERIKFVQDELLYPLRQRIEDFQQLLVVNQQGIIAMEILRKNNRELIRSVDRAKLVTVSALRTAVMVASALYDQKIVMEKVEALNATTNKMIETTANMLKTQGTQIHTQASNTSLSVDTLKTAFAETLEALDDISKYKQEALPRMKATIEEFRSLATEGEAQIAKMERANNFQGFGEA